MLTTTTTTKDTITDLAAAFLETLSDPTAPWAALFTDWAAAHGLTNQQAQAVRIEALRQRLFGTAQTFRPRPRARRPR